MKIILTGGGTGGHFYPIIAIAEELNKLIKENRLLDAKLYFMAPAPYNSGMLHENNLIFLQNPTGKMRHYFSFLNFFDLFKTFFGIIKSVWTIYNIYPDVVFGKGGYGSFPTLFAARILGIPVVIHESDSVPGRVNKWAGKFAKKIAISYPKAIDYFPKDKVAFTSNPIRNEIRIPATSGAYEFLKMDESVPTILILGGSLGSEKVNEAILEALPRLLQKYQVIHQTGKRNYQDVTSRAEVVLDGSKFKERYKPFDYLNNLAMRMSAGISDVVISRAGSTIFEIATWGIPSIIIPITDSNGDHQRKNAFEYASSGAAVVVEEKNLTGNIINSEVDRLMDNPNIREEMSKSAKAFVRTDAAEKIAKEILQIALKHEN